MPNNPYSNYFSQRPDLVNQEEQNPFAQGLSNLILQARMKLMGFDPNSQNRYYNLMQPNMLAYNPFNQNK